MAPRKALPADKPPKLTRKQEEGLVEALASLERGEGVTLKKARADWRRAIQKGAARRRSPHR